VKLTSDLDQLLIMLLKYRGLLPSHYLNGGFVLCFRLQNYP